MRGGRRGSVFFVIDAFMGAAILIFALLIFYTLFIRVPPAEQAFTYANDHLSFIATTECRDFESPWVERLIENGTIENPTLTLAEQTLIFRQQGQLDDAFLLMNASTIILPPTLDVRIRTQDDPLGDVVLYPSSPLPDMTDRPVRQSAKHIFFVLVDTTTYYGPVVLQTEVWQ